MFIGVVAACPKLKSDPPRYVDPIVTRPFESITKVLAPPEILEKMTTFVPRVPGPTSRPLLTNTFVAVKELFAKIEAALSVARLAVVARTFVV